MVRLQVQASGGPEAMRRIGALEDRVAHPAPALRLIARLLSAHVETTFVSQGARIGRGWAPLAPRTVRARMRRWGHYALPPGPGSSPPGPPNQWTTRLRGSFRPGQADHIELVSDEVLTWGSAVPYGRFVHRRRPIVGFRDAFQERELLYQPLRLYVQGVPIGAIETTMRARLQLSGA
jgi:hypothetical protein